MRILKLTSYVPYPANGGAKIRVLNEIKYLAQEHDVVLLCPVRPNSKEAEAAARLAQEYGIEVKAIPWHKRSKIRFIPHLMRYILGGEPIGHLLFYYEELIEALHQITATEHFDVVKMHHGYMAPYLRAVAPTSKARRVLELHNVPYVQWRRMMASERNLVVKARFFRDWLFQKHSTLKYVRRFDSVIVVSELDRSILAKDAPEARIFAVPTGIDTANLHPLSQPQTFRRLMMIGKMNYRPNVDGAVFFCNDVFPLVKRQVPNVQLSIVGSSPSLEVLQLAKEIEGVNVTGYVESVLPYYEQSCLTLAPLRAGSGVRVKILESMALRRPVVSTTLGCEGLDLTHNQNILIGDNEAELSRHTVALMTDLELWRRVADSGRDRVEQVHDWQATGRKLVRALEDT